VVAIGLEHHLVTPFTSLVAVDVTPTAPAGDAPTRLVPLNSPARELGLLPRTATPSTLHAFAAVALLLAGLALRPRDERGED
jgi:Ca-activated chloride channel family protein